MNLGVIGKTAEDKTVSFLRKNGYRVIKRNYSCRFGEIDIIAEKGEFIVFVEVKARKENGIVSPLEAVDSAKLQRIMLTAEDYISKTECQAQPRFDIAQVTVKEVENGKISYSLHYLENAF